VLGLKVNNYSSNIKRFRESPNSIGSPGSTGSLGSTWSFSSTGSPGSTESFGSPGSSSLVGNSSYITPTLRYQSPLIEIRSTDVIERFIDFNVKYVENNIHMEDPNVEIYSISSRYNKENYKHMIKKWMPYFDEYSLRISLFIFLTNWARSYNKLLVMCNDFTEKPIIELVTFKSQMVKEAIEKIKMALLHLQQNKNLTPIHDIVQVDPHLSNILIKPIEKIIEKEEERRNEMFNKLYLNCMEISDDPDSESFKIDTALPNIIKGILDTIKEECEKCLKDLKEFVVRVENGTASRGGSRKLKKMSGGYRLPPFIIGEPIETPMHMKSKFFQDI
jgi:hypothetical protein